MFKKAAMLAMAAGLALSGFSAMAQQIELKANVPGNEEGIAFRSVRHFADLVKEKTGGEVAVKVFHSSALGDQPSSLEALQVGILDMATIETPITGVDPVLAVEVPENDEADETHGAPVEA